MTDAPAIKVRPILFSGPMIRALIDGRKMQTRRIVKPQPYKSEWNPPRVSDAVPGDLFICPDLLPTSETRGKVIVECESPGIWHAMGQAAFTEKHCPYGQPGDLLWVRETWAMASRASDLAKIYYKAHESASHTEFHEYVAVEKVGNHQPTWPRFKPSIHMPRWASRLTVEITRVRVERLQEISNTDAIEEGIIPYKDRLGKTLGWRATTEGGWYAEPVNAYDDLWESINGDGSWDANPLVWVLSFQTHKQNVDQLLASRIAAQPRQTKR